MDSGAASDQGGEDERRTLFGLSAAESDLLEQAGSEALEDVGIDAGQFFRRLRRGESMGAALGVPPQVIELIYARAHRWFLVDRPDRAEPLFRALCAADGKIADYWVGLGLCLRLTGDLDGAAFAFATASRLRPDWAIPAFHAAELALLQRDHATAAAEITRFRRVADGAIPPRMTAEIARMEQALAAQRRAGGAGS